MKRISNHVSETEEFAFNTGKKITPPAVICLTGDLGAGKTAFSRGFAKAFGVEKGVSSPTFTIMRRYFGRAAVNHFDLYRIEDFNELLDIGFDEYTASDVSIIEWADKFGEHMPKNALWINISYGADENQRIIEVSE